MQNNQYLHISDSHIVDPVVKLLEDIRTRKTKIIIPNEDDIIPCLWNDRTIKKTILTDVNIGETYTHLEKPTKFPTLFQNPRSPNFPTSQQKILLAQLEEVPVYVVVTDSQEMVMATPRDEHENNFLNWIYKKYYNWFVWTEDDGPISLALFFLNKEDADLYLHEIGKNDPKCAEKTHLHVQVTSLAKFYKLNRTSSAGVQAKLIADLEEVYRVVSDYIPNNIHDINPKQKYTKTWYQGNPIYILKTITGREGLEKKLINYKTIAETQDPYIRKIFFRLDDAYLAWDKFCDINKTLKLPSVPELEIYNLENYLMDLETTNITNIKSNYFVATHDSFKNLEKELELERLQISPTVSKKIEQVIRHKSKKLLEFYKGIIWVFTSDTLPTEDNAW